MNPQEPSTHSTVATAHSDAFPGASSSTLCQLLVLEGEDMGRAVMLRGDTVVVGTDEGCDLVLADDRVSRRHLSVEPIEGGQFLVRDLMSLNGTLYQGGRLVESAVPAGATLKVGRTFLRIQPRPEAVEVNPSQSRRFGELVAESLAMREVFAVLELIAESDVTVLLEGETGTGKELTARAIHEAGARRKRPFVAVDCGAIPEGLLESELFGHVRGAFTGAASKRKGAFVRAHTGTLFLDELGSLSLEAQSRLLRVIEERTVRAVGADDERTVDVRIVAATQRDLAGRVAEGTFRPDLYYRLSIVKITLPPLRMRREDIPIMVRELLKRRGIDAGAITGPGLDTLLASHWPGNVRELRNVIDRALALNPGVRCFTDLQIRLAVGVNTESAMPVRTDLPFSDAKRVVVDLFERRYLLDLYEKTSKNISAAARLSGLDRKHLRTLLKRHGIVD
ncbi:MAG: Fis family transcriptional regulator [Deltaproteobacteria bacterium CG_4_9_14_3_um_filter_63_12]|nr:MAG: Fis family transcriptional regulator [Deltaproteobacteria bacterium CG_4_9_14_3_um_filter_63_12]